MAPSLLSGTRVAANDQFENGPVARIVASSRGKASAMSHRIPLAAVLAIVFALVVLALLGAATLGADPLGPASASSHGAVDWGWQ